MNNYHRWQTRSGYQARLVITYDRELRKYKVKQFVGEHNHDLEQLGTIHMLRSHRNLTESHKCAISIATQAGLTPTEAHGLMVIESGGRENLGYTLEDHKTFLCTKRQNSMKDGELRCILQYFSEKKSQWPGFYHSEQRDIEKMTTNIFLVDEKI